MAKFDNHGNLISAPNALKNLYIEHYVKRLEHRQIQVDYLENYEKKTILWKLRFERLQLSKSDNWTIKDLRLALKSLKSHNRERLRKCHFKSGKWNKN